MLCTPLETLREANFRNWKDRKVKKVQEVIFIDGKVKKCFYCNTPLAAER